MLDYETIKVYNLEITVTDNSPNAAERRSVVTRVDVRVTNINDSGNYHAEVRMLRPRISPTGSAASRAGIPTSSSLEIVVVDEKGERTIISKETSRYTLDASTKSNNLFTVAIVNGVPNVQANSEGRTGQGKLIVHVKDIYAVEVDVSVVGINNLVIKVASYPISAGSTDVTKLKQIVSGKFQQILLQTFVNLTDGYLQDVSILENTSTVVINAADFRGAFEFGPSPKNIFTLKSSGVSSFIIFKSSFEEYESGIVKLSVSSEVLAIREILKVGFQGINSTLSGVSGKTKVNPFVELNMGDNSILTIENFSYYSGLVTFGLSNTNAAQIALPAGEVTLLGNDNNPVTLKASSIQNASISNTFEFFCNPEPAEGEVDIGESDGQAIPSLNKGQTWTMNIRVNPGDSGLYALDIKLAFNPNQLEVVSMDIRFPFELTNNNIRIFGPVFNADALQSDVGSVLFSSKLAGIPDVSLASFTTVNKQLIVKPNKQSSSCITSNVLGDVNSDCIFDIVDVAFIQGYVSSYKTGFKDSIGKRMSLLQGNMHVLDVNWNEEVDEGDAVLLSEIFLGHAKFISDMKISVPNHNSSPLKCSLELKVKFRNRDGSSVSSADTSLYTDIAHFKSAAQTQFDETSFDTGIKIAKKGTSSRYGGIVKAKYSSDDGFYTVLASKSNLESEDKYGITMIQVVTGTNQKKSVVALFTWKSSQTYTGKIDLELERGVHLLAPNGYSPQRMVSLTESTARCNDPIKTTEIEVTFRAEYDDVVKEREEEAKKEILNAFNSLYPEASFTNARLRKGSVIATMDMKVPESKKETTLNKISNDVEEGLAITMNNKEVTTYPSLKVNGTEFIETKQVEAGLYQFC